MTDFYDGGVSSPVIELIQQAKQNDDAYLVLLDLSEETGLNLIKRRKLAYTYQGKHNLFRQRSISGLNDSLYSKSGFESFGYDYRFSDSIGYYKSTSYKGYTYSYIYVSSIEGI